MQAMDHDDLIASLVETCENTDRTRVAGAFVASLRTKRFDLRSPLGSYAFHFNHPLHQLDEFFESFCVGLICRCKTSKLDANVELNCIPILPNGRLRQHDHV